MTPEQAEEFANQWLAAWNAHDLDQILSHYEDDFEMSSPVIRQIMGERSGILKGKERIAEYWRKALARAPDLHFEKLHVLRGANSVTIIYRGHRGLSAEVFLFAKTGKVAAAFAHYELLP
jgi:ketosteroid isomerase-like protein